MRIEKAGAEHLAAIIAIVNAGATSVRRDREFSEWQEYLPAFEALRTDLSADIYVVLDADDGVVGTYQIHFLKGLTYKGRPRVELESVHVRSDRQGQGIGRLMIDHAERLAAEAGACMIQLTSNKERQGSHVFYKRLGYDQSHLGYKKMLV